AGCRIKFKKLPPMRKLVKLAASPPRRLAAVDGFKAQHAIETHRSRHVVRRQGDRADASDHRQTPFPACYDAAFPHPTLLRTRRRVRTEGGRDARGPTRDPA